MRCCTRDSSRKQIFSLKLALIWPLFLPIVPGKARLRVPTFKWVYRKNEVEIQNLGCAYGLLGYRLLLELVLHVSSQNWFQSFHALVDAACFRSLRFCPALLRDVFYSSLWDRYHLEVTTITFFFITLSKSFSFCIFLLLPANGLVPKVSYH